MAINIKKIFRKDIELVLQDENDESVRVVYLHKPTNEFNVGDYVVVQEKIINTNNVGGDLAWYEYEIVGVENKSCYLIKETTIYEN
jgi:hypothetical protein